MRQRFEVQLSLGQIPIEKVIVPLKSRDELPPILAGLQWIWQTPEVHAQVFGKGSDLTNGVFLSAQNTSATEVNALRCSSLSTDNFSKAVIPK